MTWTNIQIQERAKRKRNRARGLLTPPGTPSREYRPSGGTVFKPIGSRPIGIELGHEYANILARLNLLLTPWWMRRGKKD